MNEAKQSDRRLQIETAAYGLLALKGYKATSMLEVAKRAKASNETLYKWYGNKQGLFLSMVERNLSASRDLLTAAIDSGDSLIDILDNFGPQLLSIVTGQRSVVLDRAAAGDVHDTGLLGRTIVEGGRDKIIPLLAQVINKSGPHPIDATEAAETYYDLLVADTQIRRVMGVLPILPEAEIAKRAERAKNVLLKLLGQP